MRVYERGGEGERKREKGKREMRDGKARDNYGASKRTGNLGNGASLRSTGPVAIEEKGT